MVDMCEVKSRKKQQKINKQKNTVFNNEKKWIVMNPI
jgi:hypothetical protein